MNIKQGDRFLCTRNDRPQYWWEVIKGNTYNIGVINGELGTWSENHFALDGRRNFLSAGFFDAFIDGRGGSLTFIKINHSCLEEIE